MTLFQQFGIDLEYLRICKTKHGLWTWQLLIFTIAFDLPGYDVPSAEASSVQESRINPSRNKLPGIHGRLLQIPWQSEETGFFSEHSPLIKEKYLSHTKDLYITISCGYPSLCMGENSYIIIYAYNQTTATFQY